MIAKENYSIEHIRQLQSQSNRDPLLIERTLFAFGLLEALAKVGMTFIFKGGTSLMLLLPHPMRLSTDIDLVVKPDTDIDSYIEKAKCIFPFIDGGEQERSKKGNIEKRHFKFIYNSQINAPDTLYIILDVLFEDNHYQSLSCKEIKNEILLTEGENLTVNTPTIDCILGDKMTAFAPHTTGILFGRKNLEIMKQFYDISTLVDYISDYNCVLNTYKQISSSEIAYRNLHCTYHDTLCDTISSAVCIGTRGKVYETDFPHYLEGTKKLTNHVMAKGFSMEKASTLAPKIIYMAACLLTETPFEKVNDASELIHMPLQSSDFQKMNNLRKVDPIAYGYLIKAEKLLMDI